MHAYWRKRSWTCGALVLVIALGLASRKLPWMCPQVLAHYPGDALWAVAVFLCIALVRPAMRCLPLALLALGVAWIDEFAQMIQAPWLLALRRTTAGHLLLGSGFDWIDLLAYAVGIAIALSFDIVLAKAAPVNTGAPCRARQTCIHTQP
ncbi:MAG TPA: DUF2809 domain-containing protein [Telluria sp.]|jgi:hypothetical protein